MISLCMACFLPFVQDLILMIVRLVRLWCLGIVDGGSAGLWSYALGYIRDEPEGSCIPEG